jgi:hypothetical protein
MSVSVHVDGLDEAIEEIARRLVEERLEEIEPTVYDVGRAADYLGFSEGHIRRMVRERRLPDRRDPETLGSQHFFFKSDLNAAVCRKELA